MPELPEVETVVRGLAPALTGARLLAIEALFPEQLEGPPALYQRASGALIEGVRRKGKYILLDLVPPAGARQQKSAPRHLRLMIHLGMTGKLLLSKASEPLEKHTHAILHFRRSGGSGQLRYVDPRRFGRFVLGAAGAESDPERLVAGGREPLEIDAAEMAALFHGRSGPIKNLLLNQNLLRGLGNIYADESLFRAGIHPRARRLSRPRLYRLHGAVREVLAEAIAAGGSSISDYVGSSGEKGWFQVRHRVYGRTGEPCLRCGTPLRRVVLAGRSAHFCPRCQKQK